MHFNYIKKLKQTHVSRRDDEAGNQIRTTNPSIIYSHTRTNKC